VSKIRIAAAVLAAAAAVAALAGCGSAASGSAAPAASSAPTWTSSCRVTQQDPGGQGLGFTVSFTNVSASVQDATTIDLVFLASGQELESGSAVGPSQVLPGQTMSVSDHVPGTDFNGLPGYPMNAVNQCQATGIGG
jgi:hypothetical protein